MANEANARGVGRIRQAREAREEDKSLERHRALSGVRKRLDRSELGRMRSLQPKAAFSSRWRAPGSIGEGRRGIWVRAVQGA
jgi:hypothetical protein